jgi:NADH-quinone oxidoreductase subunit L
MEGPTPVSALIHAATMVTAGVYMIGRNAVLFSATPNTLMVVAVVGAATAFFAGTIGLVQNDIQRVLAYSTVSQLGYMFLGMGVGAYAAGIFHLYTHAFFKALLFLGSGAVIHALAGEQDLRNMGGLKKDLPITYWTFLIGAIAIAGVPGLAGFFSKDEILYRTFVSGHTMLWAVGMMTSLMTAFYMFRLVFLAFHGERRAAPAGAHSAHDHHPDAESHDAHHAPHLHDAPPAMAIPLVVLALGSVVAGYLNLPAGLGGSAFLEHFLEPSLHVPVVEGTHAAAEHANHSLELTLMAVSSVVALIGIGLAAFLYLKRPALPEALAARFPGAYQFLVHKGYVDELYDAVVVQPVKALSEGVLWRFDANVVDGAVNGAGRIVVETGSVVRQIQTGSMRAYAVSVLLGVVMIVGYYLWS